MYKLKKKHYWNIINYSRVVKVLNQVLKHTLIQKHVRIRVYEILARFTLTYGSELVLYTIKIKTESKQQE
jgi:hypothetical protein